MSDAGSQVDIDDTKFFTVPIHAENKDTPTREFLLSMAEASGIPPPSDEDIQKITERYQNTYVARLKSQYGFTDQTMMQLHEEFGHMSAAILDTLKEDDKFKDEHDFYKKYLETYPYLYFSVVPREVIESRLAAKCVEENVMLRRKLAEMNHCVGDLVHRVSELQVMAGIPPIAKLVFSSIPDPLVARDSEQYKTYSRDLETYHSVYTYLSGDPGRKEQFDKFLIEPVVALRGLGGTDLEAIHVSGDSRDNLIRMIAGLTAGKGCIPVTKEEWENDTTEEPPFPAERCGEGAVRRGNARNAGAEKTYVARGGPDGKVSWERHGK